MFITWAPKFNTGIHEIDSQHKRLVDIINELYDARHSQSPQAVLNVILSRLVDYADYHFIFEEALLSRLNYPELEEHMAEHQQFRNQIKEILGHQNKELFVIEDMLMEFLESWLINHILVEDMKALLIKD